MFSDSDALRFPRRPRLLREARIATVRRVVDELGHFNGEHCVSAIVGDQEVEVRYLETSGAFQLIVDESVHDLSRTELHELANALRRYQETVPWDDGDVGQVLVGLRARLFPSSLATFALRSVSDLGEVVLLAGTADALAVDLVLHVSSGELTMLVSERGKRPDKRAPTSQEALDLVLALQGLVDGQALTRKTVLIALVLESLRRGARH